MPFGGVGGDEFFGSEAYALDTDELLALENSVGEFFRNRTSNLVSLVDGDDQGGNKIMLPSRFSAQRGR